MNRPAIVEDEHLEYLDDLRESGQINMCGCGIYIREAFDLSKEDANDISSYWMKTFGNAER